MKDIQEKQKFKTVKIHPDLKELIPNFLSNRRNEITVVNKLLGENNFEKISIIGHSMKGSGGGYGFHEISSIGAGIEKAAHAKDAEGINSQIEKLQEYLDNVRIEK